MSAAYGWVLGSKTGGRLPSSSSLLEEFFVLLYKGAGADLKPMNDLAVEL